MATEDVTRVSTPDQPHIAITTAELLDLAIREEEAAETAIGETDVANLAAREHTIRAHHTRAIALRRMAAEIGAAQAAERQQPPIKVRQILCFEISSVERPMSIALDIAGASRLDEMVRAVNRVLAADAAGNG